MNRINHRKYRLRDLLFGPRKCPNSCPTCVLTYNRPKLVPPPSGPTYNLPKSVSLDIQIRIKIDYHSIKMTLHVSLYRHGHAWMILLGMPKVIGKVKAVSNSSNCTSKNESWQFNLLMPKKNEKIWKHSTNQFQFSFTHMGHITTYGMNRYAKYRMLTYKQNFPSFSTHVSCFALPIYFFEFEKSSYQSGQVAGFLLILDLTDDPF